MPPFGQHMADPPATGDAAIAAAAWLHPARPAAAGGPIPHIATDQRARRRHHPGHHVV